MAVWAGRRIRISSDAVDDALIQNKYEKNPSRRWGSSV